MRISLETLENKSNENKCIYYQNVRAAAYAVLREMYNFNILKVMSDHLKNKKIKYLSSVHLPYVPAFLGIYLPIRKTYSN